MTALPPSGSFMMVDAAHVGELGPTAAILYTRIVWRAERSGGAWRATVSTLVEETGLTPKMIRTAARVLRESGWVVTERTSPDDATLIWKPLIPAGQGHDAQSAPPPAQSGGTPPAQSAISSYKTDKDITSSPRLLRVVEADEKPAARPEVVALCNRLADRIEANGSKRPTVSKGWLTSCRLLIDRDGRAPAQIAKAIDWCQADDFWRSNVLSMPTLRKQYDRLRLAAQRDRDRGGPPPAAPRPGETFDAAYAATLPPPLAEPRSWTAR